MIPAINNNSVIWFLCLCFTIIFSYGTMCCSCLLELEGTASRGIYLVFSRQFHMAYLQVGSFYISKLNSGYNQFNLVRLFLCSSALFPPTGPFMQFCSRNLLDQKERRLMCKSSLDTLVSSLFLVFGGLVNNLLFSLYFKKLGAFLFSLFSQDVRACV